METARPSFSSSARRRADCCEETSLYIEEIKERIIQEWIAKALGLGDPWLHYDSQPSLLFVPASTKQRGPLVRTDRRGLVALTLHLKQISEDERTERSNDL